MELLEKKKLVSHSELVRIMDLDESGFNPVSAGYQPLPIKVIDHVYLVGLETLHDWLFGEVDGKEDSFMVKFLSQRLQFKSTNFPPYFMN